MSEDYDRTTGEVFDPSKIVTSPSPGRQHLMPISALPGSHETAQVWSAMIQAQQTMKQPRKTKTANILPRSGGQGYSYKYAPIEEITKVLKPVLIPVGVWYQQGLVYRGQQPFVRTMVYHTSGEWIACDYPVFGAQDSRQFAGAVTMACRRGLMLAFGITPEDDNEEGLEDISAEIKEPRTRPRPRGRSSSEHDVQRAGPRYAGAFSSGHVPESPDGEPDQIGELIADGYAVAEKGTSALHAYCELLSNDQKRRIGRSTYEAWMKKAEAKDREHVQ